MAEKGRDGQTYSQAPQPIQADSLIAGIKGDSSLFPNLNRTLLYIVEWLDGSRRTDLRTACTLRTAVTMLVRHHRQHQMHQVRRRTQHLVRTFRDTELTTRTMLSEVVEGERASDAQEPPCLQSPPSHHPSVSPSSGQWQR